METVQREAHLGACLHCSARETQTRSQRVLNKLIYHAMQITYRPNRNYFLQSIFNPHTPTTYYQSKASLKHQVLKRLG